jgi:glucose 1-dehydrogenase
LNGLKGKKVLVTGASSGIGQAIAVQFAAEGAHVAINYRSNMIEAEKTDELVHQVLDIYYHNDKEHGVNHFLVQADVTKEDQVIKMVEGVIENFGGLDILINNAGIQMAGNSHEITLSDFQKVLDVNITGAFLVAREVIKHFLSEKKPGVIINISSVHQEIPKPQFLSYAVSKGGMQNLTRTLALEYAKNGIRVNGIGPGATITPINRAWVDDPIRKKEVEKHIPLGRVGTAEEMAIVTTFLSSDDAAYITGQTLFVDGGLTLYPDFATTWSSQ